jgi:hypothetical protein
MPLFDSSPLYSPTLTPSPGNWQANLGPVDNSWQGMMHVAIEFVCPLFVLDVKVTVNNKGKDDFAVDDTLMASEKAIEVSWMISAAFQIRL